MDPYLDDIYVLDGIQRDGEPVELRVVRDGDSTHESADHSLTPVGLKHSPTDE